MSDKKSYPTFARTYPTSGQSIDSLVALLNEYNWLNVSIVWSNDELLRALVDELKVKLPKNNITVDSTTEFKGVYYGFFMDGERDDRLLQVLEKTLIRTRSRYNFRVCLT